MEKAGKKLEENVKDIFIVLVMALYRYMGCPIRFFTGAPCPGCGMTRAVIAALKFDFRGACQNHPLIILMPLIGLWCLKSSHFGKRTNYIITCVVLMIFAVCYVVRLSNGELTVNVSDGLIYKLIADMK